MDAKGLVALWREGLLAQKVLLGQTQGYRNHPQLIRFKSADNPVGMMAAYLACVADEADKRGYNFNRGKLAEPDVGIRIPVTDGQLEYEFSHLLRKLATRAPDLYAQLMMTDTIKLHPLFKKIRGGVEAWEIV